MNQYRELYYGVVRDDIEDSITNLALDYHLVSKFTSLVAVDIPISRPEGEALVSKPVVKKAKALKQVAAQEIADLQLSRILITPQTATNSQLWMIVGVLLMFVALVFRRRRTL
jgi:Ca-activated chloride channel family protein